MAKKRETKKEMLIGFDSSIPRQKKVYEFLCREKEETGISYNMIVHEALEIYMQYLDSIKSLRISFASNHVSLAERKDKTPIPNKKSEEIKETSEPTLKNQEPETKESLLSDADIQDPYIADLISNTYGNED